MDRKAVSFFIVGLAVGLLVAVSGFSLFVRSRNLAGDTERDKIVLRLAHCLDQSHPVHKGMVFMAQRAAELSGGTVEMQIFPNGQLGSETESIEQLQRGALAMAKVSTAPLESFLPEMAVFGVPYVFRDKEHYWKALEGAFGEKMLLAGERAGLRGLCYYDSGARSFYTVKEPILKPEDLEGKKIRVMKSKTSMDMVAVLGGAPTPIPWGELYTALQQGMIDGAENNPPSFFTNRHYEVCKHYSLDEHTRIPDILLISKKVWENLPQQVQSWVQQAADESSVHQRELWRQETRKDLDQVQAPEIGVKVYYPDKEPFVRKVQPMYEQYEGTVVGELIKEIQAVE